MLHDRIFNGVVHAHATSIIIIHATVSIIVNNTYIYLFVIVIYNINGDNADLTSLKHNLVYMYDYKIPYICVRESVRVLYNAFHLTS